MKPHFSKKGVRFPRTREIPNPNDYIVALKGECADWAFDEVDAPSFRGKWNSEVFKNDRPLDLEIGTGNGFHFAHHAEKNPERNLLGIELKFKPLIQSIRRALRADCSNARVIRYNAKLLEDLFTENELSDVIVHFPDPYLKKRLRSRRLLSTEFMNELYGMQKSGSSFFFKTDSQDYFDWACEQFKETKYRQVEYTRDLHNSEYAESNFETAFEKIFLRKGQPIFYLKLVKDHQ